MQQIALQQIPFNRRIKCQQQVSIHLGRFSFGTACRGYQLPSRRRFSRPATRAVGATSRRLPPAVTSGPSSRKATSGFASTATSLSPESRLPFSTAGNLCLRQPRRRRRPAGMPTSHKRRSAAWSTGDNLSQETGISTVQDIVKREGRKFHKRIAPRKFVSI